MPPGSPHGLFIVTSHRNFICSFSTDQEDDYEDEESNSRHSVCLISDRFAQPQLNLVILYRDSNHLCPIKTKIMYLRESTRAVVLNIL